MRWQHPNADEERTRTAFLWFPKRIGDESRWLERATWIEVWQTYRALALLPPEWVAIRWVDPKPLSPNSTDL